MADTCLFCRILAGELPSKRLYEDDTAIAIEDIDPRAPVHFLVIPRAHCATLNEAPPETVGHLARIAQQVAARDGFADAGYRVVINVNEAGGQTVDHLHMHVLAGRTLNWPPG